MTVNWHNRFLEQSIWTKETRDYLTSDLIIPETDKILEVGCGTGVVTSDFYATHPCNIFGLDIQFSRLLLATRNNPKIYGHLGDAHNLPYAANSFNLVFCHYFLMWLPDPEIVLNEIHRVLSPGGIFLAFAEPDHASRIDAPASLSKLGALQTDSLRKQGAQIKMGRILPELLQKSGFINLLIGAGAFQQINSGLPGWWNSEWEVLKEDLKGMIEPEEFDNLRTLDLAAWQSGSRVLWVPTFYAKCQKPDNVTNN